MRVLGYHKEEQEEREESENRLCIRFPLHPTLSHLLNLVYLLVDGLFPVPSISPSLEEWPVVSAAEGSELAVCEKAPKQSQLLSGFSHWYIETYDERRRDRARKQTQCPVGGKSRGATASKTLSGASSQARRTLPAGRSPCRDGRRCSSPGLESRALRTE
jgi:hypothetical protein